ncbi:MAG: protein kinase domain-containing protein [Phycisphaerales bacterium]
MDFLDAAFDQVLMVFEDGLDVDPERILAGRDHLRAHLDEVIELAGSVAIGPGAVNSVPEIEGYIVQAELGRGGMGAVYLAKQVNAGGRPVAIKVLPRSMASPSARERFRREAMAVSHLRHPNIVKVHDVLLTRESFAYSMEFIDGGSLQRIVEAVSGEPGRALESVREVLNIPVSEARGTRYTRMVAEWGASVADALHAVHGAGLLHRDVKPSNILIRRDGAAMLTDFGLVQQSTAPTITVSGGFAGTASYAPPEQLRGGFHELDARADVYSLGASLFHALTLRRPFPGATTVRVLHQVESSGPPHLEGGPIPVPRDLSLIVRKAMSLDATRRYPSALEFGDDLRRFLADRPVRAKPTALGYIARKFIRRNRRAVAAGFVAAVLATGAAGLATAKVFVLPRWSEQALARARLTPYSSEHHAAIFNLAYWEMRNSREVVSLVPATLSESISWYDRSILYGDSSGNAALERNVLASLPAVLAEIGHPTPLTAQSIGLTDRATQDALHALPEAVRTYALSQHDLLRKETTSNTRAARDESENTSSGATGTSSTDLRQLGLMAYLMGDAATALNAWSALEAGGGDDPYISGMLGVLHLTNDAPALAYPRLRSAMIAFPEDSSIALATADAAARCGDAVKARQYLDVGTAAPLHDAWAAYRVRTLMRFDAGEVDAVLAELREAHCHPSQLTPVLLLQVARKLSSMQRDPADAVEFATLSTMGAHPAIRAVRYFRAVADPWWEAASKADRLDLIRRMLTGTPGRCGWRDLILERAVASDRERFVVEREVPPSGDSLSAVTGRWWALPIRVDPSIAPGTSWPPPHSLVPAMSEWLLTGEGPVSPGFVRSP